MEWAAIEQLDAVRALKGSLFVYPVISALHILGIGMLLTGVVLMDLRLLGAFRSLPDQPFIALIRRVTLVGFALAVLTGATLFTVRATDYAAMPLFWFKLGLIVVAGINLAGLMLIERHSRIFGAVSLLLWLGVLLAGRFLGFVG